jgi:hypothetical protein
MPQWCPSGLTHSQKRKLQRLRAKEKKEQEAEKIFNAIHPMVPTKQWKLKATEILAKAAEQTQSKMPDCPATAARLSDAPDCPVTPTGLSGEQKAAAGEAEARPMVEEATTSIVVPEEEVP